MLTVLMKTVVNTNNNTLAKSIDDTSTVLLLKCIAITNTFVVILFTDFTFSKFSFLSAVIY